MTQFGSVLIVEDDPALAGALGETLRLAEYPYLTVASAEEAIVCIDSGGIALVVTDVNLIGMDGFGLLTNLRGRIDSPPVIMMTAYGTIERAVRAMKDGAVDYLTKPFRPRDLVSCIAKHLRPPENDDPIAVDPRSVQLLAMARRIAASDATALLAGESGTGKEVLARYLHRQSPRAKQAFVALNCAAIPENLLESILFGHEKFAFTGAQQAQAGKFELANHGTLLLDEISEMSLPLQAKLLRVLQEREVERIGARAPIALDVRVIATTNRDLQACVRDGRFREDLFYRLNVVPLTLPPLRERREDILPLARYLLARHAHRARRVCALTPAAEEALLRERWPGNVRQLDNVLNRALILQHGEVIDVGSLALEPVVESATVESLTLDGNLRNAEYELIRETLKQHDGHRSRTAGALGIAERTLRHKLAQMRECGLLTDY